MNTSREATWGGPRVLQETHFPHGVDVKAVAEAKEGKLRFRPRSALRGAASSHKYDLPQKGGERTFTTSSIWASAAHSFVFSWNSDGESGVGAP